MAIQHKFLHTDFGNGFQTNNVILDITPYQPEIMIIGTFEADSQRTKFLDFFYGGNYFWAAFKNIFIHNGYVLRSRRMLDSGNSSEILNPTLQEIFELCSRLKLTFSDMVLEILHNNKPNYKLLNNDNVIFNGYKYDLNKLEIRGSELEQLNSFKQVNWNTENIIKYLIKNPQIKTIYFTWRPPEIFEEQWNLLINHSCLTGRQVTNIFPPYVGGPPGLCSMKSVLDHWTHYPNPYFSVFNSDWLARNGVNINNFKNE